MDRSKLNTKVRGWAYMMDSAKHGTISVVSLLEYVEPEIATILDKSGARIHLLKAELFSNIESFLNHLDIDEGDTVIVVASTHDTPAIPTITKAITAKGARVRTFVSYKLPASTFVLGVVKKLSF